MADMSTFSEKPSRRMWTVEPQLDGPLANFTIPGSGSITFFDGQAVGRDASGGIVQMDDTLKAEFVGFETDVIASALTVQSTDTLGDKKAHIHRPLAFVALIASAAAGQEGQKVYWLYNNQVAYTSTNQNLAGTVLGVLDSTHVLVLAPWVRAVTQGGLNGIFIGPPTSSGSPNSTLAVLTKWDVNKLIVAPLTAASTYTLPLSTTVSPGDEIRFIQTSASQLTISPTSPDHINGSGTGPTLAAAAYTAARLITDGNGNWYEV